MVSQNDKVESNYKRPLSLFEGGMDGRGERGEKRGEREERESKE